MKPILFTVMLLSHATLAFPQMVTVTVEGVGFVAGGDAATARDRAIADAQIRAVEQAFGVEVDARIALHKSLLIDDTIMSQTRGVVSSFRIIDERMEPGGLYRIRMEAEVDPATMEARLAAAAGAKRVMLIHPAGPPGDAQGLNLLIGPLAETFATAGFQLARLEMDPAELMTLDESTVKRLAGETRCDIIVTGMLEATAPHCPVSNYCAALAAGHVRLYDGHDGSQIAAAETGKESSRGFGHDAAAARRNALANAADRLITDLADTLFHPRERRLTVVVMNIPDLEGYRRLKTHLEALRWVSQVTVDSVGYHPVKSIFYVRFAQRPELFAGMLDKLGAYRLTGNSRQTFTLTAR